MRARAGAGVAGAFTLLLAAALLAASSDADARGGRRSGGSSFGKSFARSDSKPPPGGNHLVIVRTPGGSSTADGDEAPAGGRVRAVLPGPKEEVGEEELARRAAAMASYQKATADHEAARKAATERGEWARDAAAKMDAKLAAQQAEAERAEFLRRSAADQRRQREQATLAAEVEQVLERAKNDHPVLRTPDGEPILRAILARQKVLQERGVYPSIAMVEAVADHSEALRPRVRAVLAPAAAQEPPDHSRSYGNCRWVTPYNWSCK